MKVAVFIALALVALVSGHSLGTQNAQLRKNKEMVEKLARIVLLSAFARMDAKAKMGKSLAQHERFPVLPDIPDPSEIGSGHYSFSSSIVSGTLSQCQSIVSGTSSIVDDMSIDIFDTEINWSVDIPAIHLEGLQELGLDVLGGALSLTAAGGYTIDLTGVDIDLFLDIDIHVESGNFDVHRADLKLVFARIDIFADNSLANGEELNWVEFSEQIKPLFDQLLADAKPDIDEIIRFQAGELTKSCDIYTMIGGDTSCIGNGGLMGMIQSEIDSLVKISKEEHPCGLPPTTTEGSGPTAPPPPPPPQEFLLYSDNITDWGEWGPLERCPEGTYAQGFQVKNEGDQLLLDDTAMNGLRLYCGTDESAPSIKSAEGGWGGWGRIDFCPGGGYINGFQLRAESGGQTDDTAANNLRAFCSSKPIVPIEGDGNQYGEWRALHKCGGDYRVCGLQTEVEGEQGTFGDDTALNNVAFLCCRP